MTSYILVSNIRRVLIPSVLKVLWVFLLFLNYTLTSFQFHPTLCYAAFCAEAGPFYPTLFIHFLSSFKRGCKKLVNHLNWLYKIVTVTPTVSRLLDMSIQWVQNWQLLGLGGLESIMDINWRCVNYRTVRWESVY